MVKDGEQRTRSANHTGYAYRDNGRGTIATTASCADMFSPLHPYYACVDTIVLPSERHFRIIMDLQNHTWVPDATELRTILETICEAMDITGLTLSRPTHRTGLVCSQFLFYLHSKAHDTEPILTQTCSLLFPRHVAKVRLQPSCGHTSYGSASLVDKFCECVCVFKTWLVTLRAV